MCNYSGTPKCRRTILRYPDYQGALIPHLVLVVPIVFLLYYFFKGVVEASLYNVGLVQCMYM